MLCDMTTMFRRMCSPITRQACRLSSEATKLKPEIKMNDHVYNKIDNEEIKARKHPGRLRMKWIALPEWLPKALEKVLEDTSVKSLVKDGINLSNYLHARQVPAEQSAIQTKLEEIKVDITSQKQMEKLAHLPGESLEKIVHDRGLRAVKQAFYGWAPVEYNKYAGFVYLVSRSAKEYAVLGRIMTEIAMRDKEFKPMTLFDFGSGVGSTIWAANQLWPDIINEHMCVDISSEMNDISESIISHSNPKIKGAFYRQYMPISHRTYDIVVSAYTLLELPSMQTRLETITKLWAKTAQYLIIVEQGTNAGFKVVNEARDFILYMQGKQDKSYARKGHIFSPCPHELKCPRYRAKSNTPCNFQANYEPLPLPKRKNIGTERYSYVVFKRGPNVDETKDWPRLVRETSIRSKQSICRMCTAQGKLEEIIFRASDHGKWMYWCARSSRWGDRLPVETFEPSKVQQEEKSQEKSQGKEFQEEDIVVEETEK